MKLGYIAVVAIVGSIGVSAAMSRQPAAAPAQPAAVPAAAKKTDNLRETLAVFRSDLSAAKVRMLNQVMKMTPEEAAKFWPVYQKYEAELNGVNDRRIELIKQFVALQNGGKLTDAAAGELSGKWLQVIQDRLDLWKKYNGEIGKAVSPMRGAQFLQVEHQISLLVDINIASEMPVVGEGK